VLMISMLAQEMTALMAAMMVTVLMADQVSTLFNLAAPMQV
jgi:hypothetical protein